jgi:hypothetical protein
MSLDLQTIRTCAAATLNDLHTAKSKQLWQIDSIVQFHKFRGDAVARNVNLDLLEYYFRAMCRIEILIVSLRAFVQSPDKSNGERLQRDWDVYRGVLDLLRVKHDTVIEAGIKEVVF